MVCIGAIGETRYIAVGFTGARLHGMVATETKIGVRVVSLRKVSQREVTAYGNR